MRVLHSLVLVMPLLGACVVRSDHSNNSNNNNNQNNNPQPVTVIVDTDQTMTDTPGGDGVGVFVQYAAGGHWHVWWTCDTNKSGLPCDFTVDMSGSSITNAKPSAFETNDSLDTTTPNRLVATTHTTVGVEAVDFDATPGANVTLDVSVSGLRDGGFFFWVGTDANGKPAINGNYQGQLSDPLVFSPSAP
jgi:hypothetical protein